MPQPTSDSSSALGTAFSFVLVLAFTVFMTFTSVRTYVLYGNYTGLTDHFNTIGVIFLIFKGNYIEKQYCSFCKKSNNNYNCCS